MKVNLLFSRILYLAVWLMTALYAALCETDTLPTAYFQGDAQTTYLLHMLCVVFTLGCSWFGLRFFVLKGIRSKLQANPQQALQRMNLLRIGLVSTPIMIDLVTYYALLNSTTPLFCLLIALTALVFCWPKTDE